MSRVLKDEGVEAALAYVITQRAGIVEKVKARAAAAREKNRAELLPLLKSAQLQAGRNHPEEAERLFTDLLELEPAWTEARNAFAWFLIQRGEVIEPAQGNAKLQQAVQICQGTLALNPREKSPQDWAAAQVALGFAFEQQSIRSAGAQAELFAQAVTAYRSEPPPAQQQSPPAHQPLVEAHPSPAAPTPSAAQPPETASPVVPTQPAAAAVAPVVVAQSR
ncbi:MAG: hypothetical protein JOZ61_09545, partial [Verrucomicrobia bacterium]|nr:hypothetical protein [Verrucomicrobiota bacterium]